MIYKLERAFYDFFGELWYHWHNQQYEHLFEIIFMIHKEVYYLTETVKTTHFPKHMAKYFLLCFPGRMTG